MTNETQPSRFALETWHGDAVIDRSTRQRVTPRELLESHDALLEALERIVEQAGMSFRYGSKASAELADIARAALAAARGEA